MNREPTIRVDTSSFDTLLEGLQDLGDRLMYNFGTEGLAPDATSHVQLAALLIHQARLHAELAAQAQAKAIAYRQSGGGRQR